MINVAMLVGRVGKKDNKTLKNGGTITVLSLATSKNYRDSSGKSQQTTTWHNVSCFNQLSEIANQHIHVGDLVFVQGEIQNKKIESGDKAGQYMYSIMANKVQLIPTGKKNAESKPNQEKEDFELSEDVPF